MKSIVLLQNVHKTLLLYKSLLPFSCFVYRGETDGGNYCMILLNSSKDTRIFAKAD